MTESNYTLQKRLLNTRATLSCHEAADHAHHLGMQALGKAEFRFHLSFWVAGTESSCCHYGMLCANVACTAIVSLMLLLLLWMPRGRHSRSDSQPHSLSHRIVPMKSGATSLYLSQRAKSVLEQEVTALIDGALN